MKPKHLLSKQFETSLIDSGFTLENSGVFAARIYNILEMGLGVEQDKDDDANEELVVDECHTLVSELEEPVTNGSVEVDKDVEDDEMEHVD